MVEFLTATTLIAIIAIALYPQVKLRFGIWRLKKIKLRLIQEYSLETDKESVYIDGQKLISVRVTKPHVLDIKKHFEPQLCVMALIQYSNQKIDGIHKIGAAPLFQEFQTDFYMFHTGLFKKDAQRTFTNTLIRQYKDAQNKNMPQREIDILNMNLNFYRRNR